jgi:hypothetical protein
VEQNSHLDSAVGKGTSREAVALYMFRTRRHRVMLFLPPESYERCVAGQRDSIRRAIRRMMLHGNAVVRWFGRIGRVVHKYYQKLEDRIDPLERMIKALNCSERFVVLHAPARNPRKQFRDLLRGQLIKHGIWITIDGAIAVVCLAFFWVLAPLPGPNVFLYYPALRSISHYRAILGIRRTQKGEITFREVTELEALESHLRAGNKADKACETAGVRVNGLNAFLQKIA